jgi:hypothetical protein
MTQRPWVSCLLLLCAMSPAWGEALAGRSASPLVEAMQAARESEGFEIRLTLRRSGGGTEESTRIALIGQSIEGRERLLVRAISPSGIRDRAIVSERVGDHVRSTAYGPDATSAAMRADPMAGVFGSGLVVWDLMAPWWNWPDQVDEGPQAVGGRQCTQIRSRPAGKEASPVREVLSCVDAANGLSLKTMLFDGRHRMLRSIEVTRDIRTQAGRSTARSASIADADGAVTFVDVYSGDEHYLIRPGTFDTPAGPAQAKD